MMKLPMTKFIVGRTLIATSLLMSGCEVREIPTSVNVGPGPSFSLRGSGRLATFTVYAPTSGQKVAFPHTDVSSIVWQIWTTGDYFKGARVDGLKLIYGRIPDGYKQTAPTQPQVPSPLQPGLVYSFFAESTGAGVASGAFYVGMGGTVVPVVTDLCLALKDGRNLRVSCATGEPYREPTDVEKFAHEHQKPQ